jgi:hypothetical protein
MKLLGLSLVSAALLLQAAPALAQPSDPAAADALFRRGREAAEKGDWGGACPKFAESQRLDPTPGTLLNLADCEEHLGQVASAREHYKTALETMSANDDRIAFAKQHIAALDRKVPHLTLNATPELPASAKVMRDDVQLGSASFGLPLPLDPGSHSIVVIAPGHADRKVTISLKPGEALALSLKAGEAVVAPPPPLAPASLSPSSKAHHGTGAKRTDPKRTIGIALGAVGIAGVAAGAVTGILVLGDKSTVADHCDPITHACDQTGVNAANDGKTFSTVSTVAFAAGGALFVTGLVLFLTARSDAGSTVSTTVVAPQGYAGGAGLSLLHTF